MARDFDGTDDNISVGGNSFFVFGTSDSYTLACWVYHDNLSPSKQNYIRKDNSTASPRSLYLFRKTDLNVLQAQFGTVGTDLQSLSGSTTLLVNTWYFVALVRNVTTDTVKLYISTVAGNVIEDASATDTTTTSHGNIDFPLRFGQAYLDEYNEIMNGKISNVSIIKRALNVSELELLKRGAILPTLQMGCWFLFGEQSPEPDWSGNNNHGTVTGAVRADHPPGISAVWLAPNPQRIQRIFAAAGGGDPEGSLIGGKLIRGGLLKHGVLVGR